MLSNTATPKYYGAFREKVLSGEIPVCQEVSMTMNLIDQLIADPEYYYDDQAVEGFIRFCEKEMVLTDGTPVRLTDYFKLWAEDLYGWYEFREERRYNFSKKKWENVTIKYRLRNIQYLIVGRGAAKSLYDTYVQAYGLVVDDLTTQQITTAPTMVQSAEVMAPFETAITRSRGPLFKFMTATYLPTAGNRNDQKKLCSTKDGIKNKLSNSLLQVRPMSIQKLQGLRCKYATLDEWLSCEIREDPIGAIEQGASKIKDYQIVATSSEGTIRAGIGDSIKLMLYKILRQEWWNPHISIWYYKLDNIEEVADPRMWVKANPGLGITVTYETYQRDVDKAEKSPADRNDILAKRFGIPVEGYTYFFTYEETLPVARPFNLDNCCCSMGVDWSQGDDFCAFTFLFPINGRFKIITRCYVTSKTMNSLHEAAYEKYQNFIKEGGLVVMEGTILNSEEVYEDISQFIYDHNYVVICWGYDPYGITYFEDRYDKENGEYGKVKVPQGVRTESVPLGELKHLAEEGELEFYQEIMSFCMGNCITLEDNNGNRKLYKKRRGDKIDSVAALMDAFVAYKVFKDDF